MEISDQFNNSDEIRENYGNVIGKCWNIMENPLEME